MQDDAHQDALMKPYHNPESKGRGRTHGRSLLFKSGASLRISRKNSFICRITDLALFYFVYLSILPFSTHDDLFPKAFSFTTVSANARHRIHHSVQTTVYLSSEQDNDTYSENEIGSDESTPLSFETLQQRLQHQQTQIDALIQLLTQHQKLPVVAVPPTNASPIIVTASHQQHISAPLPPLKVMLFIDGTWLYYSLYERAARECPLIQKYGKGWPLRYTLDWTKLPNLLVQQLQGVVISSSARAVEIVRASVYTSYKADTNPSSYRYRLFEDLRTANYDVHMMETVGKSEKCVDIQLAVDMLHFATVSEGAYDVALLLSGDKDFIPAMIRTRQKGKAVGLVSMKRGCNRALLDTQGLRDFDVLWLEDYLDDFIVARHDSLEADKDPNVVSVFTLCKVLHDYIRESGYSRVASRDIGRYLKHLQVGGSNLLEEVKHRHVGLLPFLRSTEQFLIETDLHEEDKADRNYWVSLVSDANDQLLYLAKNSKFTEKEYAFFQNYNLAPLRNYKERFYGRTYMQRGDPSVIIQPDAIPLPTMPVVNGIAGGNPVKNETTIESYKQPDYSKMTVPSLREICREYGLPTSGVKATLIIRIQEHRIKDSSEPKRHDTAEINQSDISTSDEGSYLIHLVEEYLLASGGKCGSRDLGRYLAANKPQKFVFSSALKMLKNRYGSLRFFLSHFDQLSVTDTSVNDDIIATEQKYEFQVSLKRKTTV